MTYDISASQGQGLTLVTTLGVMFAMQQPRFKVKVMLQTKRLIDLCIAEIGKSMNAFA